MALDAAAVTALTADIVLAIAASAAAPGDPTARAAGLATAIQTFVLKATPIVPITGAAGTTPGTIT